MRKRPGTILYYLTMNCESETGNRTLKQIRSLSTCYIIRSIYLIYNTCSPPHPRLRLLFPVALSISNVKVSQPRKLDISGYAQLFRFLKGNNSFIRCICGTLIIYAAPAMKALKTNNFPPYLQHIY